MALIDDFKARFPALSTDADTYIPILEPVYPSYYAIQYSAASKEATLNLLAHLLVLEKKGNGAVKIRISQSAGSVSASYAAPSRASSAMAEFYSTTKYGQTFIRLTSSRYGGVAV